MGEEEKMIPVWTPGTPIIGGVHIGLIIVWVAIKLAAAAIPTFPIPGLPGSLSAAMFLKGLTGPLLGPYAGFVGGLAFGILNQFIFPYTAFFGPLTFLTNVTGFTFEGLALYPRKKGWIITVIYFIVMLLLWYFYKGGAGLVGGMPLVTWEHWFAILILVIPWVRNFMQESLIKRDNPAKLFIALFLIGWVGSMANNIMGCVLAFYMWDFTNPIYWVPMIPYYAATDILASIIGSIVGTAVLISLKRANIRVFIDELVVEES
ncbi:MAG: hypothetical protein J7L07_10650 [Candidatus Odinarchaeota archaeon]|nr:hypothetical protein [Candidatus Odinarchaeota archaeon]